MDFRRNRTVALAVALFFSAAPAGAEQINWALVDSGVLNHATHGTGIEMRIMPDPVPEGLFKSPELPAVMHQLCTYFAPSVVPFVQEKTDLDKPDFLSVRIVSGSTFGRYVLEAYAFSDGGCGDTL